MTRKWYVLRTRPRSEHLVANELDRNGFNSFCPRVKTPRPDACDIFSPLFPGYLFLQIDMPADGASLTRDRPGILGWLRFGDTIPSVPDEVVANIRRRVQEINNDGGLWRRFRQGDRVRVISGKLESLAEVLEETVTVHGHVRVMLDFMGRMIPAQVPLHSLSPIDGEQAFGQRSRRPARRTRGRGRWIQGHGPLAISPAGN